MRIVHDFNIDQWKCTLMRHNNKYTLKVEDGFGAIHFKLGDIEVNDFHELESMMKEAHFLQEVKSSFSGIRNGGRVLLSKIMASNDEEFDVIV